MWLVFGVKLRSPRRVLDGVVSFFRLMPPWRGRDATRVVRLPLEAGRYSPGQCSQITAKKSSLKRITVVIWPREFIGYKAHALFWPGCFDLCRRRIGPSSERGPAAQIRGTTHAGCDTH